MFPLPQNLIDGFHHAQGDDGLVVIESCQDTTIVSIEDYTDHLQQLSDQLGYPILAIYGDGCYDPTAGAATTGTWIYVTPGR